MKVISEKQSNSHNLRHSDHQTVLLCKAVGQRQELQK